MSLSIPGGDFCVLVGKNGAGKTTLLRSLVGLSPVKPGEVLVAGLDPAVPEDLLRIRRRTGFLFQNPDDQLVAATVEEEVAFGLMQLAVPEHEMQERIREALDLSRLSGCGSRPVEELSGGEKQRLALASLLAMRPEIFLLDEPASFLDFPSRESFFSLLKKLNGDGKTILLVTHDVEEAAWGKHVAILHEGRILDGGDSAGFFGKKDLLESCGIEVPYVLSLEEILRNFNLHDPH